MYKKRENERVAVLTRIGFVEKYVFADIDKNVIFSIPCVKQNRGIENFYLAIFEHIFKYTIIKCLRALFPL